MDISKATTNAIINAANQFSFKPMDGGVSGALWRACKGMDNIVDQPKIWWNKKGVQQCNKKL